MEKYRLYRAQLHVLSNYPRKEVLLLIKPIEAYVKANNNSGEDEKISERGGKSTCPSSTYYSFSIYLLIQFLYRNAAEFLDTNIL